MIDPDFVVVSQCAMAFADGGALGAQAQDVIAHRVDARGGHARELSGIDHDALPTWQRRGIGLYREQYEKEGVNPVTGARRMALRGRVWVELDLPHGRGHAALVADLLEGAGA